MSTLLGANAPHTPDAARRPVMHPQLSAIVDEFESARSRLHLLAGAVPDARWAERADPARWSVAECVAHLNLTSRAYVPLLRDAIARARALRDAGRTTPARYRRDPVGWVLWRTAGPVKRVGRVKTTAPFVPAGELPRDVVLAEFERLQDEQLACVRDADGLPLGDVRVVSPFDARVRYNLYACLTILPRHQHRHLFQAEQVWGAAATA